MGVDRILQVRRYGLWKAMKIHIDINHCNYTRWGRENMDVDLKEQIFDPTMSVVTRTSTARVPEVPARLHIRHNFHQQTGK